MTRFASAVLALAFALPIFAAAPPPMPHALYWGDPRHPVFLAAEDVFDDQGRIKHDAPLTSEDVRMLTGFLKLPRMNGCIPVEEVFLDYINAPSRRGVPGAIAVSDFVIETKVLNRSYGFMQGVPGQLLQLQTVSELKRDAGYIRSLYYIFVPVADFTVGGLHFCKTDRGYGDVPQLGDTVFVFADRHFMGTEFINVVDQRGFVRALPDGRVPLPRLLAGDVPVLTVDEIRRMARGEKGKPEAQ